MKIYTTYFAMVKKLPANIVPISIAIKPPNESFAKNAYRELFPTWNILKAYKDDGDEEKYTRDYKRTVLNHLLPEQVYKDLKQISNGNDVALVCYEKPENFCHRHIVADWMEKDGYTVTEWKS